MISARVQKRHKWWKENKVKKLEAAANEKANDLKENKIEPNAPEECEVTVENVTSETSSTPKTKKTKVKKHDIQSKDTENTFGASVLETNGKDTNKNVENFEKTITSPNDSKNSDTVCKGTSQSERALSQTKKKKQKLSKQQYVLFVGKLPKEATQDKVLQHFEKCGEWCAVLW